MTVHFQGMSKTLQFPQTVALQGAPTCSVGISPYGLYNRLNDAGRLIMLNQKAIQFASAPFVRIGDKFTMLTQRKPQVSENPDDIPAVENYYHPPIAEKKRFPHHCHAVAGDCMQAGEGESNQATGFSLPVWRRPDVDALRR